MGAVANDAGHVRPVPTGVPGGFVQLVCVDHVLDGVIVGEDALARVSCPSSQRLELSIEPCVEKGYRHACPQDAGIPHLAGAYGLGELDVDAVTRSLDDLVQRHTDDAFFLFQERQSVLANQSRHSVDDPKFGYDASAVSENGGSGLLDPGTLDNDT